jgi:hypothetical protein
MLPTDPPLLHWCRCRTSARFGLCATPCYRYKLLLQSEGRAKVCAGHQIEFDHNGGRQLRPVGGGKKRGMTTALVNASKHEGVMVLELTNPPANTYSYEMMRQLDAHVLDARFDAGVHVLLITGAGDKFFCAGADIKMLEGADPYFKYVGAL